MNDVAGGASCVTVQEADGSAVMKATNIRNRTKLGRALFLAGFYGLNVVALLGQNQVAPPRPQPAPAQAPSAQPAAVVTPPPANPPPPAAANAQAEPVAALGSPAF